MSLLHELFSLLCSQKHNWLVGGLELPFCQRCTGLYVGAVPALLVYFWFRPKATNGMLWTHGMCLLLMVPFGYHLVAQSSEIRMLTGQIFAIGLVYYLTLLFADRWWKGRELLPSALVSYFVTGLLALLFLQAAVIWGGPRTGAMLSWLGFGGLLVYGLLVLANLVLLTSTAWTLLRGRTHYSER
jgi:uncharacterized membrane protein